MIFIIVETGKQVYFTSAVVKVYRLIESGIPTQRITGRNAAVITKLFGFFGADINNTRVAGCIYRAGGLVMISIWSSWLAFMLLRRLARSAPLR